MDRNVDVMEVDNEVEVTTEDDIAATSSPVDNTGGDTGNDQNESNNVASNSSLVSTLSAAFHPLVLMNIADHWTRIRAQAQEENQVFGALLGKTKGRNVEIMNSYEFKVNKFDEENIIINREYYNNKEEQYKQVFGDLDLVGWYTTGQTVGDREKRVHRQIAAIHECGILFLLNPHSGSVNNLPVTLYEPVVDIVQGQPDVEFIPITYTLATEEAERIGVDHVARMTTSDSSEKSAVAENLVVQLNAIKMLFNRVKIILDYVKAVGSGELQPNLEILREAHALGSRLPVLQTQAFNEEFYTQSNDVSLMTYLGVLTKGCNDINQFITKFNILYDRQVTGKRMRGLFF